MYRLCLVLVLLLTVTGCGGAPVTDRLNGVWLNSLAKYELNFTANTVTRTVLGATDTKPFTVISQDADSVTIRTDGDPITITLIDDTTATIAQAGKIPMQVKRQP